MHLLRTLPGGLPGRRYCRRAEFRIRHRDARRALLRQGAPAFERRPLGTRSRQEHRARRALPVSSMIALFTRSLFTAVAPPAFPPPLWGRDRERGTVQAHECATTPHPNPPPQGGREPTEQAAPLRRRGGARA